MSFTNVVIKQLQITIKQISKVRAEGAKLRRDDLDKAVKVLKKDLEQLLQDLQHQKEKEDANRSKD